MRRDFLQPHGVPLFDTAVMIRAVWHFFGTLAWRKVSHLPSAIIYPFPCIVKYEEFMRDCGDIFYFEVAAWIGEELANCFREPQRNSELPSETEVENWLEGQILGLEPELGFDTQIFIDELSRYP